MDKINYLGYLLSEEKYEFVEAMKDCEAGYMPFSLQSDYYGFLIEPSGDSLCLIRYGENMAEFKDIDDMLLRFKIGGKKLIELLADFGFAD